MLPDLTMILGNIGQSLEQIKTLFYGLAYLLGLIFFMTSLKKLQKVVASGRNHHESIFPPLAYAIFGALLFYLPSSVTTIANTAFGEGNILSYANFNKFDLYSTIGILIRTAGLIWFIRGCVLLAHSSNPGVQHGPKGLAFLISGVLALNFDNVVQTINYVVTKLTSWTISIVTDAAPGL